MRLFDQPSPRNPAATVRRSSSRRLALIAGASSVDGGVAALGESGTGGHAASTWSPSVSASSTSSKVVAAVEEKLFGAIGRMRMTVRCVIARSTSGGTAATAAASSPGTSASAALTACSAFAVTDTSAPADSIIHGYQDTRRHDDDKRE